MPVKILAETSDYLVINKPSGMLVHPTQAKEKNTLADWLVKKYPEIKNVGDSSERPGIVHRLDKDASGVLVVAKSQKMFEYLKKQFQDRKVEKQYLVLVYGKIQSNEGIIDFAIDRGQEGKMVARPKLDKLKIKNVGKEQPGREAVTDFWVEKRFTRFTLVSAKIHTGRTHQIRVHFFAYGHPVVGDRLYFNKKLFKKSDKKIERLFLHAEKLCFSDLDGEKKCFESKLPEDMRSYLKDLK